MKTDKKQKVLIALDYDRSSQKVAEKGYSLAAAMNADIVLLHVIADPTYYSALDYSPIVGFTGFSEIDTSHLLNTEMLKKTSRQFLEKLKHHLGDDTIQTLVEEGDFADAIIKASKETHADVIVMGSHSRKWLENIVLGSVTEKVMNHTTIPLFIVPTKKQN